MELRQVPTYLPVRDVRNANPAWVRQDLGNLTSLKTSLAREGMVLPILVLPNFVVVDGARRLVAAEKLHWREVPVIVANEWETVPVYYSRAQQLREDQPRLPRLTMRWVELVDLADRILSQAYAEKRLEIRRKTIEERRKLRDQGVDPGPSYNHSAFVASCSIMLGYGSSDLRTIREIYSMINRIQEQDPQLGEQLLAVAEETEQENAGLYGLLRMVREIKNGRPFENYKRGKPKRRLSDPPANKAPRTYGADGKEHGRTATVQTITNLSTLLTSISTEAQVYTSVEIRGGQESGIKDAIEEIRTAVNHINSYRRLLEAAIATPQH